MNASALGTRLQRFSPGYASALSSIRKQRNDHDEQSSEKGRENFQGGKPSNFERTKIEGPSTEIPDSKQTMLDEPDSAHRTHRADLRKMGKVLLRLRTQNFEKTGQ